MKNIKFLLVLALGVFTMVSCKSSTSETTTVETTTVDSTTVVVPMEEATAPAVDTMAPTEVPADSSKM